MSALVSSNTAVVPRCVAGDSTAVEVLPGAVTVIPRGSSGRISVYLGMKFDKGMAELLDHPLR